MTWEKAVVHKSMLPALARVSIPGAVYLAFCLYGDECDGANAFPSLSGIARALGVSVRSVQRAVLELVAAGLLVPDGPGRNRTKRYTVRRGATESSHQSAKCVKVVALSASKLSCNQIPLTRSEKIKNKICAAEPAPVAQPAKTQEPDRPPGPGPGPEAGEGKDPTPSGRSSRQELAHQVVHGSKSELWQAISAAGIRLGGRDRFRFLAQEEQTRQAVAYLLEQGRLRRWPEDPAAFLIWAWGHVGGRGAESLAQLRKADVKPRFHTRIRPLFDTLEAMDDHETDDVVSRQRQIHAEQEQRLADEISRQAIKRPWTQAEKDLQARLDEERARARQALGL